MAGNSFGHLFRITTAGESHGPALLAIVDGCPPGLPLCEADIQPALDRRRPGSSAFTTARQEKDQVRILSGTFQGKTTGTAIALIIENHDARTQDYTASKDLFRPGHGDFSYQAKYGIRDYRGGGRASARETAMRVAAAAIAEKYLRTYHGIEIIAFLHQMGDLTWNQFDEGFIEQNAFFFPDRQNISKLAERIKQLREEGDSIGAAVKVMAKNVPAGLGEPVFAKLDAIIAQAMMSINAAKAVAIGDGFDVIKQKGSENRDAITQSGFSSNHNGGILAGISTGQAITATVAFKPSSSIRKPIETIDKKGNKAEAIVLGRHDPCVGIRAVPIVKAMMACLLLDFLLQQKAIQPSSPF